MNEPSPATPFKYGTKIKPTRRDARHYFCFWCTNFIEEQPGVKIHPQCAKDYEKQRPALAEERRRRQAEQKANLDAHRRHPDRFFETATPADRSVAERWFNARPRILEEVITNRGIRGRCGKYGLAVGTWMAMVARQNSRCAICETELPPLKLHIDHDHETGTVRGLLCSGCNTGLGMLRIDGDRARQRASNLTRYLRFGVLS